MSITGALAGVVAWAVSNAGAWPREVSRLASEWPWRRNRLCAGEPWYALSEVLLERGIT